MTIYYLDILNGDDAKNGLTWANAKRTPANLCATYAITGADEVRFAKDCTPYDFSTTASYSRDTTTTRHLTMGESVEMYDFLNEFADGEVTVYNSATKSTASNSSVFTGLTSTGNTITTCQFGLPASPATNTKYFVVAPAAWDTTPIDLSAYQEIWGYFQTNSALPSAPYSKKWRICLCSDTAGSTIVDDLEIEFMGVVTTTNVTNAWMRFRAIKSGGANLGSAIKSVAIYSGNSTVWSGSTFHTFAGAIYGCKTDGKLKVGDFLWFDKANRTHTLLVHSAVIGGTTSAPKIYQMQSSVYPVGQNFSNAPVKRIRPRYRFESEPDWTATDFEITTNFPAGNSTDYIKWSGGWNTGTNTRDGYTTFGNFDYPLRGTKALIGQNATTYVTPYWYAEGFVVGANGGLLGFAGSSSYGAVLRFFDCVALGTNCSLVERTDTTSVSRTITINDANEIWSTFPIPDVGGAAAIGSRIFYTTLNAATNRYTYCYNMTLRNSCVSAGAIEAYQQLSTLPTSGGCYVTNVTFVGGEAGDTTVGDAWFHFWLENVTFADAQVVLYTRDNSTTGMSARFNNLTFWHNGSLNHNEAGGTTYKRLRYITEASNWAFYGTPRVATTCTINFVSQTRRTLNSLIMQASNYTLHLGGNVDVTSLTLSGGSVLRLRNAQYMSSAPVACTEHPVVKGGTYDVSTLSNFALHSSNSDWEGTFENVAFTFPDAATYIYFNGLFRFRGCSFATASGGPTAQRLITLASSTSFRSVMSFEGCTFNGIGFTCPAAAAVEIRLFLDWCTFSGLTSTNYDVRVKPSASGTIWIDEVVCNNVVFANGGLFYNDTNAQWHTFRGKYLVRNAGRTQGLHSIIQRGALAYTQTGTRHTASGYAWALTSVASTHTSQGGPSDTRWPLGRIAVKDGSPIRISLWVRATASNSQFHMIIPRNQISAEQAEMRASTTTYNTWEELVINYTPNATGILEVYVSGTIYGGDAGVVGSVYGVAGYWDDFAVDPA